MKTSHLTHRHGGKIVALHAVAHSTFKGVAGWHFEADVVWDDGSGESKRLEVAPWALCFDAEDPAAKAEGDFAHHRMTDYLNTRGVWHDHKKARSGVFYSWTPTEKAGREEFPEVMP